MCNVLYEGKTKIICLGTDDKSCIIKFKDTLTALNGKKSDKFSGKGKINAAITCIIYKYLADNGIKTHFITSLDEYSIIARKAEIIQTEVIVRNIAAGSFSKKYGVEEGLTLKNVVVEFSYKNDELDDPMINESQLTAIGIATKEELCYMADQSLKINTLLKSLFENIGIKLVDFKLEFGRSDGELILCDEISPDSCRLWDINTNYKFDKDRFRKNLGNVIYGYFEVFKRLNEYVGVGE